MNEIRAKKKVLLLATNDIPVISGQLASRVIALKWYLLLVEFCGQEERG